MMWLFAILIVLALGGIALLAAGKGTPMTEVYDDRPDLDLPDSGAILGDDLRRILELRDLGRRGLGLIRQNYGMSIAVNAAGLVTSGAGAMSPVVAAILHNASSVAVVTNSSRLIRYQIPPTRRR